jgi:hypothetical protein
MNLAGHPRRREPGDEHVRVHEGGVDLLRPGLDDARCAGTGAFTRLGHGRLLHCGSLVAAGFAPKQGNAPKLLGPCAVAVEACRVYLISTSSSASRLGPSIITARVPPSA